MVKRRKVRLNRHSGSDQLIGPALIEYIIEYIYISLFCLVLVLYIEVRESVRYVIKFPMSPISCHYSYRLHSGAKRPRREIHDAARPLITYCTP